MQVIQVLGLASGRTTKLTCETSELSENLLKWLRRHGITVASSCDGEGVCKKCVIQNDWLTCKMTVGDFLTLEPAGIIKIAYL